DRRRGETARVRLILDSVFNGNQTRMAEQVRASQSMISKVARGERAPGRPLLETLARLPGLNSDWVLAGEGQPFPPATQGTLPIALTVLPGPPVGFPALLTGERHPIAQQFERETRYFVPVVAGSLLCGRSDLALLPGDLLLLDANRELWVNNLPG